MNQHYNQNGAAFDLRTSLRVRSGPEAVKDIEGRDCKEERRCQSSNLSSKIFSFVSNEVGSSAGFRGLPAHTDSNQVKCHILTEASVSCSMLRV